MDQPILLRPEEVQVLLGISRSQVYELMRTGRLPVVRIGRSVRVPTAQLLAQVEKGDFETPEFDGRPAGMKSETTVGDQSLERT